MGELIHVKPKVEDKVKSNMAESRTKLQEEFISNVTLHGFKYLFIAGKVRRFVWWMCFVGAFVLAIILFYNVLYDYLEYKSFSVNEIDYDVTKLDLPTLTFCNKKPYTKSKFTKFPGNLKDVKLVTLYNDVFNEFSRSTNLSTSSVDTLKSLEASNITTYEELLQLYIPSIHDILKDDVAKSFTNEQQPCLINEKPCRPEDFKMVLNRNYQPCTQFNPYSSDSNISSKYQEHYSSKDGFHIYFNLNDADALGNTDQETGVVLSLNYRGRPHYRPFAVQLNAQAGYSTNVIMEDLRNIQLLPPPHGKCGTVNYQIVKNLPYTWAMCKFDCELHEVYKTCGCVSFDFDGFVGEIPVCNISKMVECYTKVNFNTISSNAKTCKQSCLQECQQYKYPIRVETTKLGLAHQLKFVKKNAGWKNKTDAEVKTYVEDNIVGITVAYNDIVERREVTTASVTVTTLLGTIGGSIGLGLGFSVLTLVEFIFFLIEYTCFPVLAKRNLVQEQF